MLEARTETRHAQNYLNSHRKGSGNTVTLQGSSEYMDADVIKNDFRVATFPGCPTLFNKNTFEPELEVKSPFVLGITQPCRDWCALRP